MTTLKLIRHYVAHHRRGDKPEALTVTAATNAETRREDWPGIAVDFSISEDRFFEEPTVLLAPQANYD